MTTTAIHETARRIVDREVCYCVSALVSTLAAREWDGSIDPNDFANCLSRAPDADDYREAARDAGLFDCPPGSPRADGRLIHVICDGGLWGYEITDADGDEIDSGSSYGATEVGAWRAAFDSFGIDHPDGREVYEHWLVTDWLADKLEAQGEAVARDVAGLTIWGRCTTGQAIYADAVVQRIAHDMLEA